MISKTTVLKGLHRALTAFVIGAASAFAMMPVNLDNPERYITALIVGMIGGGLMGVQKLINGYVRYDVKK